MIVTEEADNIVGFLHSQECSLAVSLVFGGTKRLGTEGLADSTSTDLEEAEFSFVALIPQWRQPKIFLSWNP